VKSNITDNEGAKMRTSHGVIQGYTGVATVDSQYQIVVHAEVFGQGQEHGLLKPVMEGVRDTLAETTSEKQLTKTTITADSCYYELIGG
jgi:hypothetical protein